MVGLTTVGDKQVNDTSTKPRVLVLCFDGTSNEFDSDNTNIVKFFAMLRKDCETEQLSYYQTGIGTYTNPGIFTPVGMWVAKILDEAFAWYLDAHVMGGYRFLMQNYRAGDKITLFGFSRGAYTARALAGMLTKVGLLPRDNFENIPFAYKMFANTSKGNELEAAGFKQTFCRSVEIEFIGVWDTVASTGIIKSRDLPFTTANVLIKTFRHALSLDEHRAKFVPTFYHRQAPPKNATGTKLTAKSNPTSAADPTTAIATSNNKSRTKDVPPVPNDVETVTQISSPVKKSSKIERALSALSGTKKDPFQLNMEIYVEEDKCDVKEVWFCGCHSDVGGGAVLNSVTTSLADIPLRWMIREVIASGCGIQFDLAAVDAFDIHINPTDITLPTSGSGEGNSLPAPDPSPEDITSDTEDAAQPMYDALVKQPLWWLLEIIPLPFSWQNADGVWKKKWEFHLGRGRYVNEGQPLLFHKTVKIRMDDKQLTYTPKAKYTKGQEVYIW